MVWCSIKGCKNDSLKRDCDEHIKFNSLPTDIKLLYVKNGSKCAIKKNINLKHAKICSKHFSENCYRLEDRLLNIPIKKRKLNSCAIPTLFLPAGLASNQNQRQIRYEKNVRKKEVNELLAKAE